MSCIYRSNCGTILETYDAFEKQGPGELFYSCVVTSAIPHVAYLLGEKVTCNDKLPRSYLIVS